ncbi:MAG: histone deacetylase, partial [Gammaproteobacteria bacterium]|nr:histone deacetylase [Gammaproteobacteria bacterium]
YDPIYLDHNTGFGHPERSERLSAALEYIKQQPFFEEIVPVLPRSAEPEWVQQIHTSRYMARAETACLRNSSHLDSLDVAISTRSFDVALQAAGGALELGDRVVSGALDNAFGLIRPPGHHAEQDMALGFCLFNNIAILARYLQKQHGLQKVLILDWDVHHGNGTQHTFEEDPSVFYVSLHQYPYYPGTGAVAETGKGRGRGATLNCPMPAGADDNDYQSAFTDRILPAVNAFGPEIVLISAGFDAHAADPLAQINLSTECYSWMSERMMEVADQHADGKLIALLEGGYDLKALAHSAAAHLRVLAGLKV